MVKMRERMTAAGTEPEREDTGWKRLRVLGHYQGTLTLGQNSVCTEAKAYRMQAVAEPARFH
jgi:hypothetical protein